MSQKPKVLIVDDDADTRLALTARLNSDGFETSLAGDGVSAITVARRDRPDAIILDLGIPAGDGFSVIERLKSLPDVAFTPVIVVTGQESKSQDHAMDLGAFASMQKPVDYRQLHDNLMLAVFSREGSEGRVLIVEDDEDARLALATQLQARHYEVVTASDGASVLPTIRRASPDIVLLDLGIPGGDGFKTLERIRANADCAGLPVIVVSARERIENERKARRAGASAFVPKPVDSVELLRTIKTALKPRPVGA